MDRSRTATLSHSVARASAFCSREQAAFLRALLQEGNPADGPPGEGAQTTSGDSTEGEHAAAAGTAVAPDDPAPALAAAAELAASARQPLVDDGAAGEGWWATEAPEPAPAPRVRYGKARYAAVRLDLPPFLAEEEESP
jgi:hypothetical protein